MNFKIVKSVIDYIELNCHTGITNDIIEEITGNASGYVRNEFKKIVDLSLDEYRIRRELSLIIDEIKENNLKLCDSNLLPWATASGFSDTFKKVYGISPMQFIKNFDQNELQPMFDIDKYELLHNDANKIVEALVRSKGNRNNAIKYILSLRPYLVSGINNLFISEDNIVDILIKGRYSEDIRDRNHSGEIPQDYIKQHKILLEKYYDLTMKRCYFNNSPLFADGYVCVKANIVRMLLNDDELNNIINAEFAPCNLTTIWHDQIKMENLKDNLVAMPNELINGMYFNNEEWAVLHELVMQEEGFKRHGNIEDLRNTLVEDYSFAIDELSIDEVIEVIKKLISYGVIFLSYEEPN